MLMHSRNGLCVFGWPPHDKSRRDLEDKAIRELRDYFSKETPGNKAIMEALDAMENDVALYRELVA
jgi:hypothetical protein